MFSLNSHHNNNNKQWNLNTFRICFAIE